MPGEKLELYTSTRPAASGDVVIKHLNRAFGTPETRGQHQVWTLTSPATMDMLSLGELVLTVRSPTEIEVICPRAWSSWITEVRPQLGRPVPRPGRKQIHLAYTLPLPTRLPLLGLDLHLSLANG